MIQRDCQLQYLVTALECVSSGGSRLVIHGPNLRSGAGQRLGTEELACRPGSVPGGLAAGRGATIHLGPPLPAASCGLPAHSGGSPSNVRAPVALTSLPGPPLLDLAPGGVYRADQVTPAAGGLLHHRFTLTSRRPRSTRAVCSLWHCPAGHPGWVLPTALPCGARTFLGPLGHPRRTRSPGQLLRTVSVAGWWFRGSSLALARASTPSMRTPGRSLPVGGTDPASCGGADSAEGHQLRFSEVSSMTNDVCSEESSTPEKLTVTV